MPVSKRFEGATPEQLAVLDRTHEVEHLSYDLWTLRITLTGKDVRAYVDFGGPVTFRVLDEGDLLEFWNDERPPGRIWEVLSGGWKDAMVHQYRHEQDREYMVLGQNDCVTVLTREPPTITVLD